MSESVEKELTQAEWEEMTNHVLYHDAIEEIEKDTRWHQNVLNNMMDGDPARGRFERMLKENNRILELKRRYAEFGAAQGHLAV